MKRKRGIIPRIFITLLRIGLIFTGVSEIMLGFAGRSSSTVITDICHKGGECASGRSLATPLPSPVREVNGFTKKIGDLVYLKAAGKSTVRIRYFLSFCYINAIK